MAAKLGRRTLLTPELIDTIAELVAAGNNLETSAASSGISKSSFFSWMARGRAEQDRLASSSRALKVKASEALYVDLVESVERARAQADARLVLLIHRAAQEPKTWQAAAWLLERRDPQRWGRTSRDAAQGSGSGKGAVQEALGGLMAGPGLPVEEATE